MSLEKKVERLSKKVDDLQAENAELKAEISELKAPSKQKTSEEDISRRSFLKKLGAGAVGLGALGISPAVSQLKISKNGFSAGSSGSLNLRNSNLELNRGNYIKEKGTSSGFLVNKTECPTDNPNNQIVKAKPLPKGIVFVTVHETSDSAMFILEGPGLGTYEINDPNNSFGSSKNSGNDYNVYYDSNKDQYDIQNDTSSDRGFHVWHFGRI